MFIGLFCWSAFLVNALLGEIQCPKPEPNAFGSNPECLCSQLFKLQLQFKISEVRDDLTVVLDAVRNEVLCKVGMILNDALATFRTTTTERTTTTTEPIPTTTETTTMITTTTTTEPTTTTTPTTTTEPTTTTVPTTTMEPTTVFTDVLANCKEILKRGIKKSGIYTINPDLSPKPFDAWCDMDTAQGGWTVLLNRFNGIQAFHWNWTYYQSFFGSLSGEFWLGLDHLHEITGSLPNEVYFQMADSDETVYARYSEILIGDESEDYLLKEVGTYSGTAGDSFSYLQGSKFSTIGRDNSETKCPIASYGAWWFKDCMEGAPNGIYYPMINLNNNAKGTGIHWYSFSGNSRSLRRIKMMVRPIED